jgi:poly-gamma-glutamate synthesis protein (capsule biosynthesis protein)
MTDSRLMLGLVGDLLLDRDEPETAFAPARGLLAAPDILFGNLEGAYTDRPHPAPSLGVPIFPARHNVRGFGPAGFHVLAAANNHIVDAGHEAMLETLSELRADGVAVVGAGENLARARAPAIVERRDRRVAFLAYASVFPMGYEARSDVPGIAPLRAYNHHHEAYPNYHIPGTAGRVETFPDAGDLANLEADLAAARREADIVVASFHWGDFLRAFHLTDHEKRTARFALDRGADLVVGHHHHMLRGMEWIGEKPVMYGLGHFVFDVRLALSPELATVLAKQPADRYTLAPRDGWPLLPMHPDARLTLMAWATFDGARATAIGFVPCRLRPDGRVEVVNPESEEGREVVAYLEQCQTTQDLNGRFEPGPEIGGYRSLAVVPIR